jgi:hypothetical protein
MNRKIGRNFAYKERNGNSTEQTRLLKPVFSRQEAQSVLNSTQIGEIDKQEKGTLYDHSKRIM